MNLKSIALFVAVQLLILGGAALAVNHYQRAAYTEHVTALNVAADRDTTVRYLRDTLGVSRRQAEQLQVSLDQRTHERDEKGVALAKLKVTLDTIHVERHDTAQQIPDGIRLTSQVDTAGVHAHAVVNLMLVPPPARALWVWDVRRDPIALAVDFSCHRDTALAHVAGPTWATINITQAQQSAQFCNPPPPKWNPLSLKAPSVPVAAALIALGWFLHK